jgi:hypothetical protein
MNKKQRRQSYCETCGEKIIGGNAKKYCETCAEISIDRSKRNYDRKQRQLADCAKIFFTGRTIAR